MLQAISLHAIFFVSIITSVMGAICVLRKLKIVELQASGRNFMILGALCAMPFGFVGATTCLNMQAVTPLNYLAAAGLCIVGLCATVHIYLDLFDRLNILKMCR
ncbi:MAG: hypothetical protein C0624_07950 [Desulfuromonas sp.]|nr:MAG: hypothetical protein C0624_07950 [Desulfuromonas sp.]